VTQTLMRGPRTWLPDRPPQRSAAAPRSPFGIFEHPARACGARAVRREHVERWSELTASYEDGSGEVYRRPGRAEITLAFEHAGEHWALQWTVDDRRQRARLRALERRFFGSLRCTTEGG